MSESCYQYCISAFCAHNSLNRSMNFANENRCSEATTVLTTSSNSLNQNVLKSPNTSLYSDCLGPIIAPSPGGGGSPSSSLPPPFSLFSSPSQGRKHLCNLIIVPPHSSSSDVHSCTQTEPYPAPFARLLSSRVYPLADPRV